jgi:16S rRNA processing protein RimM
LAEDDYYFFRLEGFEVLTQDGVSVGRITDLLTAPESDLLVVTAESGGREVLVPFVRTICVELDTARKRLVIDPPEGLLELNEI